MWEKKNYVGKLHENKLSSNWAEALQKLQFRQESVEYILVRDSKFLDCDKKMPGSLHNNTTFKSGLLSRRRNQVATRLFIHLFPNQHLTNHALLLSWIKNMYQISFACFFIWLRTKWNRQVKALKKGNRWPAGGFCGNPWASPIKLTPF